MVRKNLRLMISLRSVFVLVGFVLGSFAISAQDSIPVADVEEMEIPEVVAVTDTVPAIRKKLDGIAAVIGDYVILDSDIEKAFKDYKRRGMDTSELDHCTVLSSLMEDRLYAHQAVQDSLFVSDVDVQAMSERQIMELTNRVGGDINVVLQVV